MSTTQQSNNIVQLSEKDLPAYCPNPAMPIWSSHPRVYLDLEHSEESKCPYCSTVYRRTGPGKTH